VLGLAALLTACRGLPGAAPGLTRDTPAPARKVFLWRIATPVAVVHLLGSIHVASPDVYPLDARVESAFDRSSTLVLEIPVDAAAQQEAAEKLRRAGSYPPGETLDAHLDAATIAALRRRLSQTGIPYAAARTFRPWLLATLLTLREMERLGYRASLGVDRYFAQKAADRTKPVRALESVDEQVALFAGMPDAIQVHMLRDALAKLDDVAAHLPRVLDHWRRGEAVAVDAALVAPLRRDSPELYRRLFAERNARMASEVAGYLERGGTYFVVVGSGHLVGPAGVLDLLEDRGYRPVQQ
jgi:uncharacterized protein YbaP (TraB family)